MDRRTLIYLAFLAISFYVIQLFFPTSTPTPLPKESTVTAEVKPLTPPAPTTSFATKEESFYVLENEYAQIVFSNIGGAIAEINLPFKSEKHPKSLIRPVEADQALKKTPENLHFPLQSYYTAGFQKQEQGQEGGYYPLLRRSQLNAQGELKTKVDPIYYAFNLLQGQDEKLAHETYKVVLFEKNKIEFALETSKGKITKSYTFSQDPKGDAFPYLLDVKITSSLPQTEPLYLSSGTPEVEIISNTQNPSIKYRALIDNKEKVKKPSLPKTSELFNQLTLDWVSNENGFFSLLLNPKQNANAFQTRLVPGKDLPTRLTLIDAEYNAYPAPSYPGYQIWLVLSSAKTCEVSFFFGPCQNSLLKSIDQELLKKTGSSPAYIDIMKPFGFFSFISEPFALLLFWIMKFFYLLTHSWGLSIILLTIAFRVMIYPLNSWSIRSTFRMNEVAPMVKIIQAKYKKDPKRAQMEIVQLYREKKVNPASGCLPLLIQMPFLIGMFDLLKSTFELRGVPFVPGWIENLTAPDVLFSWSYPIYFIGTEFHLLPVLLGIIMLIQAQMNIKVPPGGVLTEQQKQSKIMSWVMTIVLTFLFYNAASGLNLYFFFSMLLGILQQWYMGKRKQI